MSDIRDCGTSPQRPTSDWASRKSPRNVVVEQRRVPVEVPLRQRTGLPRSVATIGRPAVFMLTRGFDSGLKASACLFTVQRELDFRLLDVLRLPTSARSMATDRFMPRHYERPRA